MSALLMRIYMFPTWCLHHEVPYRHGKFFAQTMIHGLTQHDTEENYLQQDCKFMSLITVVRIMAPF
jgi:hypothetical protein